MKTRVLTAVPIIGLLILTLFILNWFLILFTVLLSLLCLYEITKAFVKNDRPVNITLITIALVLSITLFIYDASFSSQTPLNTFCAPALGLFLLLVIAAFIFEIFSKKPSLSRLTNTLAILVYPQLFFVLLYLVLIAASHPVPLAISGAYYSSGRSVQFILLLTVLPAMFSDTSAYLVGRKIGRRKLAPVISPNKTVEGSLAGLCGGAVAALLIYFLYLKTFTMSLLIFIILGILLAAASQLGDLAASLIKRKLNIKDYGSILPGHGGILDRMDGIIFCFPIVYIINYFGIYS